MANGTISIKIRAHDKNVSPADKRYRYHRHPFTGSSYIDNAGSASPESAAPQFFQQLIVSSVISIEQSNYPEFNANRPRSNGGLRAKLNSDRHVTTAV